MLQICENLLKIESKQLFKNFLNSADVSGQFERFDIW